MKKFKKLLSIIFSLSIIFTMCTSNLRTFSFTRDLSRYLDNGINDLSYECKNENNFTHLCNAEDLTYEKISNMTFDEFKAKYTSSYDMGKLYAFSKLKSGEKHATINYGDVHHEYFRVNAVDEILDFFKTKYNYGKKDFEQNCEKNLNKSIALYALPFAALYGIATYLICSLWKGSPEKSKECKDKNCEKNKQPLSQKLKIMCSAIGSVIGGTIGVFLGREFNAMNLGELDSNYFKAKISTTKAFEKRNYGYATEDWTDNDVLRFVINLNDPNGGRAHHEYYNIGIGYSKEEQETIDKEYETLDERISDTIFELYSHKEK